MTSLGNWESCWWNCSGIGIGGGGLDVSHAVADCLITDMWCDCTIGNN